MTLRYHLSYLAPFIFGFFIAATAFSERLIFDRPFAPAAHGFVHETERPYRAEICLNGRWDFQAVPVPSDFVRSVGKPPELGDPLDSGWDSSQIKIPSPWNVNAFQKYPGVISNAGDYRYYPSYPEAWEKVEMAWMRRKFTVPKDWSGKDVLIHFEAVAGECEVRVNGKFLKRNFNLNLPFDADASSVIRFGEENELLVGVRRDTLFFKNGIAGGRPLPSNTFWGWECAGIWQDVSVIALPKTHITDVFVKPLVSQDQLAVEVKVEGSDTVGCEVEWNVYRWIPPAPSKDLLTLPEQTGVLDDKVVLNHPSEKMAGALLNTQVPVKDSLKLWSPETPNLYGVVVELKRNGEIIDRKYIRFGWRQYAFEGNKFTLNGKAIRLRCDAIHFMGVSDLTRRQAFAYFQTLRDMHVNLARSTIQIRPRSFYEVADEVGMMVLGETGIWADYAIEEDAVWDRFREECVGLVLRDRNHASVVGWSVENEFFASLGARRVPADVQIAAAKRWEPIIRAVQELDPTRPWVSADGEAQVWPADTYKPPVPIAHYGDLERYTWYHKTFGEMNLPWGITESTDQYWMMPDSYETSVGDRVYDTLAARMDGVGWQIYDMLVNVQEPLNGFMTAVYNVTWYGLKPLPIGHSNLTQAPTENDGVWFGEYREGEFGAQPERLGPYSVQFNPGYDPALPLYDPWPSFYAQQAAYTPGGPAPYKMPVSERRPELTPVSVSSQDVMVAEGSGGVLRTSLAAAGIQAAPKENSNFLVVDAAAMNESQLKTIATQWKRTLDAGGTVFVSSPNPETLNSLNKLLPAKLELNSRSSASIVPNRDLTMLAGIPSAAGFFSAPHGGGKNILVNGMEGDFVKKGTIWFTAPDVDWRQWGIHLPELQRTVSIYRGELESKPSGAGVVEHTVGKGRVIVSTLAQSLESKKHVDFMRLLFGRMGVAVHSPAEGTSGILNEQGVITKVLKIGPFFTHTYEQALKASFVSEADCRPVAGEKVADQHWEESQNQGPTLGFVLDPKGEGGTSASYVSFWLYSPLENEIVQNPHGSNVTLNLGSDDGYELWVNGLPIASSPVSAIAAPEFELKKGWNHVLLKISNAGGGSGTILSITSSNVALISQLKTSINSPTEAN